MVMSNGQMSRTSHSHILKHVPGIDTISEIKVVELFNVDSANMQISHWQKLAALIDKNMDKYDGFVVIHGTDTMVYSASALSFILVNLVKPVIFTGSQKPISDILSDARNNLLYAVHMATLDIPEVCIYFDYQLFRANRTKKTSSTDFSAFSSPNMSPLVTAGIELKINTTIIRRPNGIHQTLDTFDDRVMMIGLFPGMNINFLNHIIDSDTRGIIIQAFGTGTVPNADKSIIPFIKKARKKGKIVAISSQTILGGINLNLYENARDARDAGAISCGDMTFEASIIKMMFLLGQFDETEKVCANFSNNLAGELTV